MSPYELLDLALAAQNRLDAQWALFITVHLALLGAIIYVDRPLRGLEKAGAILFYLGFAFINFRTMNAINETVNHLYLDIFALRNDPCCSHLAVVQRVVAEVGMNRIERSAGLLIAVHVLMAAIVVLSVLFDKALSKLTSRQAS